MAVKNNALIGLFLFFAVIFCIAAFPSSVKAEPVDKFAITSGINTEKTSEITFDTARVISGTAEKGTQISISVYEPYTSNNQTLYKLIRTYNLTVGSTGIFSQSVNLMVGSNYIVVAARKTDAAGTKYSEVRTTINRKDKVIKSVLSQSIAIPGQSGW